MANRLVEGDNNLPQLDYSFLLEEILKAIEQQSPTTLFKLSSHQERLTINTDVLANLVAQSSPRNAILGKDFTSRTGSVNFSEQFKSQFPELIQKIKQALQQKLETFLAERNLTLAALVNSLITPLSSFQSKSADLSLSYPFDNSYSLKKQLLSVQTTPEGSKSSLKFHKLTITIHDINQFDQNLQQGLRSHFNLNRDCYEDHWEIIENHLNQVTQEIRKSNTDYSRLRDLVDTEFLGQLKREASIKYLEYLAANISPERHPDVYYLKDLIRRLKRITEYFNDPDKSDDDYKFYYQGVEVDLRQLLSRADAFEALPIIPLIGGYLGETTDHQNGRREFVFGLKLKLNGKVQAKGGGTAFAYHMGLIDPDNKDEKEAFKNANDKEKESIIRKNIKTFFLYYVILSSRCQPGDEKNPNPDYHHRLELDYEPFEAFDSQVLTVLKTNDDDAKRKLLASFHQDLQNSVFNIEAKINRLAELLKKFLNHKTILKSQNYPFHIGIHKAILEEDGEVINQSTTLFKSTLRDNPKKALQYVYIENANVNPDLICQLPGNIKIEDIRYQQYPETQNFSLTHDISGIKTLPVLLVLKSQEVLDVFLKKLKARKVVILTHETKNKTDWLHLNYFNYYASLFILQYISLKIILPKSSPDLFVPVVRLHHKNRKNKSEESPDKDIDKDIGHYSKALAHLLNQDYLSNSQGFDISEDNTYKAFNGLTSLYSVLPKTFTFADNKNIPTLDKLLLIVVSSREADAKKGNDNRSQRLANLMGEIITFNRQPDGKVRIKTEKSFGDNYSVSKMYNEPTIILDTVTNLYRQGYRHFLYVAQAPYTSTLNITKEETQENDGLYFHSQKLVSQLYQDKSEIKLYPIFFDKYYVRKIESFNSRSFYLQDSHDITKATTASTKQAIAFFNLFNGLNVSKEGFYNGVISYATLLSNYEGSIFDQQHILENLIYNNPEKQNILQYLALFHFYRCEKAFKSVDFKLDPYDHIIGDESIGKKALFKHINGKSDFNVLAFLTEVAKVLRGLD